MCLCFFSCSYFNLQFFLSLSAFCKNHMLDGASLSLMTANMPQLINLLVLSWLLLLHSAADGDRSFDPKTVEKLWRLKHYVQQMCGCELEERLTYLSVISTILLLTKSKYWSMFVLLVSYTFGRENIAT